MKKFLSMMLATIAIVFCFGACSNNAIDNTSVNQNDKIKIVATIFPEYDWVTTILGDNANNADITMLLDNGVDLHSYQPTAEDILKITTCDMFIYVGGESDKWVEDVLQKSANKNMKVVNLMEILGDSKKEEEMVEGMEDHDHEDHEDEEHIKEENEYGQADIEYDEHVWLSLNNAKLFCSAIESGLSELDPDNADLYKNNFNVYNEKLSALDNEYKSTINNASKKTVLFGDRFPFRYLVDDYGLSYYAAFLGCSAETEASFKTITFLADKVNELQLNYVLTIEKSDNKIAKTIIENTNDKNQQILSLNSMQSTTSKDISEGQTYLSIMENNLSVLREALN